jgi:hypothetical protein
MEKSKSINEVSDIISKNTTFEMEMHKNTKNHEIKVHKNPLHEANKYLCKNDVYDLFRVLNLN